MVSCPWADLAVPKTLYLTNYRYFLTRETRRLTIVRRPFGMFREIGKKDKFNKHGFDTGKFLPGKTDLYSQQNF
ncbi:MAG TPA: hypothetical protein PLL77_02400 [Pyrinomonadaceae bacterium]|nr:hypothetical protein [Pyrinomonadaceae bacterium]